MIIDVEKLAKELSKNNDSMEIDYFDYNEKKMSKKTVRPISVLFDLLSVIYITKYKKKNKKSRRK